MILYDPKRLYTTLLELGIIPKTTLDEVYTESTKSKKAFDEILLQRDLITDENLGQVIADLKSFPFISLQSRGVDTEALRVLPEVFAKKQKMVAFSQDEAGLHIATTNPEEKEVLSFIERKTGLPVKVYFTTEREIENALTLYSKGLKETFDEIIKESLSKVKGVGESEPSIVRIVDAIIEHAYQNRASDIHIEPYEEKSLVRFRIDGILHDIVELPKVLHPQIVTRVKVMAKLRTDEHQAAQDGKISQRFAKEEIDVRVSIVPITEGEKVVMRLLSERSRRFSINDLGMEASDLGKVQNAFEKPHGMILATGPTGCGKTTTLYAVLKILNKRDVNIMTIEDPVEYQIEGVNQIQVNPKTELTFAKGLRSIVRQDPDIILVGEIRDEETADISINAAMTGHLVLSTLHTNDAATTIPRLMDMGVEPFLIASTVNVIIAQRLVRKICQKCRYSEEVNLATLEGNSDVGDSGRSLLPKYFGGNTARVYKGKGCNVCHKTGYEGRVGIFEVLLVDDTIKEAIVAKEDAGEIQKLAIRAGMTSMFEDGIKKVKEGITTIEEVLRVTKE